MIYGNKIYAPGALRKFLDARQRGESHEVLTQLAELASSEQRTGRPRAAHLPSKQAIVIDLERARLERESQSAPIDP